MFNKITIEKKRLSKQSNSNNIFKKNVHNEKDSPCFCDIESGICYITNRISEKKQTPGRAQRIVKPKEVLNAAQNTNIKITIAESDSLIIFKNFLAFRGDFENKNGIVYDQNMVKQAVEQYKAAIEKFPYFKYMLDGHLNKEMSDSPDSYKNIIGFIKNIQTDDKYKAVFIDFAIFKNHPTGKIIKDCLDNDLPIGVSAVIYASDAYKIPRVDLKRINPDVVFLDEVYPELSNFYHYENTPEVIYYTGDGFITRIDVVYKPAFETHTKSVETRGYLINSVKNNQKNFNPKVYNSTYIEKYESNVPEIKDKNKNNSIITIEKDRDKFQEDTFRKLEKEIKRIKDTFEEIQKIYNIQAKQLNISLLLDELRLFQYELLITSYSSSKYMPHLQFKENVNLPKRSLKIFEKLITIIGKKDKITFLAEEIKNIKDVEDIKKLFQNKQKTFSEKQKYSFSILINIADLIREYLNTSSPIRKNIREMTLFIQMLPDIIDYIKSSLNDIIITDNIEKTSNLLCDICRVEYIEDELRRIINDILIQIALFFIVQLDSIGQDNEEAKMLKLNVYDFFYFNPLDISSEKQEEFKMIISNYAKYNNDNYISLLLLAIANKYFKYSLEYNSNPDSMIVHYIHYNLLSSSDFIKYYLQQQFFNPTQRLKTNLDVATKTINIKKRI